MSYNLSEVERICRGTEINSTALNSNGMRAHNSEMNELNENVNLTEERSVVDTSVDAGVIQQLREQICEKDILIK